MTDRTTGIVKWYDDVRGYGFVACEDYDGDVLIHYGLLKECRCKSVPEGAVLQLSVKQTEKGLLAERVYSIDLEHLQQPPRPQRQVSPRNISETGDFEEVEVKWFDDAKGYGFVIRGEDEAFVHAQVVRSCRVALLMEPGQLIEAQIGKSDKGLAVAALRPCGGRYQSVAA